MTKAEIVAALKQLLSKADFTAAVNALATWVQGKFSTLKTNIDQNVVTVAAEATATAGSVKTYKVKNSKETPDVLGTIEIPNDLSQYDNTNTDFQSGAQVDQKINSQIASVYKPAGNIAAAGLTSALLVEANLGKVYNLTEDATTTADWAEGAGKTVKAGTEVTIIVKEVEGTPTYLFNAFTLAVDLSNYLQPEDFETIGTEEAAAIVAAAISAAENPTPASGD